MSRAISHLLRATAVLAALVVFGAAPMLTAVGPEATSRVAPDPPPAGRPLIQIALLLDTSNSMDGLINQAKSHLWRIVNEFATARRDGHRPRLEVALYEYGNNGLSPAEGYVRQVVPMTVDLDRISEELFALRTNGGHEFCGTVIRDAVRTLAWDASNRHLKAIFIAGNEPFTQGDVHYVEACRESIGRGVIVNTIHCGPYDVGVAGKWKHGAELADGSYCHIDQDRRVVHVEAPQDARILTLNKRLNETYVPYGRAGAEGKARQEAQDAATASLAAPVLVQRAAAKSSALYQNARWDLVDAVVQKKVKLEEIKDEQLPEKLRKMSLDERRHYIREQAARRAELQGQIQSLSEARDKFVAEERAKRADKEGEATLDDAIIETARRQAAEKNFSFEK